MINHTAHSCAPTTRILAACACAISLLCSAGAAATQITVENASFEDVTGLRQATIGSSEFHFGLPSGWEFFDPNGFVTTGATAANPAGDGNNGIFTGTLDDSNSIYFNEIAPGQTAPDGTQVAILFGFGSNTGSAGLGEYGIEQTLGTVLTANTIYELTVEVGNIGSGDGFDLSGFPGYRVALLAGGVEIAADNNSLTIAEREFAQSTVSFTTGAAHAQLGQTLGIRLVNLNPANPPPGDIEVDFDDVQLSSFSVPEPASAALLLGGFALAFRTRRRRANRSVH